MALHQLKTEESPFKIDLLLTTLNADNSRVSMHGVALKLVRQQAQNLGLRLEVLKIPPGTSLPVYNELMESKLRDLKNRGYTHSIFGDILLEDLREYREKQLAQLGLKAVFPLWKKDTKTLAHRFIDLGYKAKIVCVNASVLAKQMAGREFDKSFLNDLPETVDWCGENGEFHTFVYDGPLFSDRISFAVGETQSHSYQPSKNQEKDCFTAQQTWDIAFWFTNLIPK